MAGFDFDPNSIKWDVAPGTTPASPAASGMTPTVAAKPDASGIVWDAHPADIAAAAAPNNQGMSEPQKYLGNAVTGLQNAAPAFLSLPNAMGQLGDWALKKTGLDAVIPTGMVANHTYDFDTINKNLYDATNALNRNVGLPEVKPYIPETGLGKVGQDVLAGIPMALTGPGGWAGLAARQGMNLGGTLATDAAAKVAPDSPGVQLLAGLIGSVPGMRLQGPILQQLGAAPSRAQALQQDFNDLDIRSNIFTTAQSPTGNIIAHGLSNLPATAGPVRAGMTRTLNDTGNAAENIAGQFGTATNPIEGGTALRSGITAYRDNFQNDSDRLYTTFNGMMNQNNPVDLSNTLASLQGPMNRFPSNPGLGAAITNPTLQKFFNLLSPQPTGIPGLLQGGTLSFPELHEFRTTIGRAISDPTLINDIPRSDLKNVYAGISADLQAAAQRQSPQALAAFNEANNFYRSGMNRIDQLEPLLTGSPEQSFAKINAAAGKTGSANAGLLGTLRQSLPQSDWGDVGAAVIRKMGEPTSGAATTAASEFSAASFGTNFNRLSNNAKDALFGPNTMGSVRSDLEKLARVTAAQKNVDKFANHSNTASHLGVGALMLAGAERLPEFVHNPKSIIPTVLGGLAAYGGANAAARALMVPGFSRWLYQNATITRPEQWMNSLTQLTQMSRLNTALQPIAQQVGGMPPPTP